MDRRYVDLYQTVGPGFELIVHTSGSSLIFLVLVCFGWLIRMLVLPEIRSGSQMPQPGKSTVLDPIIL